MQIDSYFDNLTADNKIQQNLNIFISAIVKNVQNVRHLWKYQQRLSSGLGRSKMSGW